MDSPLLASAKLLRANVALLQRGQEIGLIQQSITPNMAICSNLDAIYTEVYGSTHYWGDLLKHLFRRWSKFSGNPYYPVPHLEQLDPEDAFDNVLYGNTNFWVGEYGSLRIELLDFIIDTLTKEEAGAV